MSLYVKRIYEAPAKADGFRILVDRLWPRGMKKEEAQIGLWMKEVAPTTELRQWFHSGKGDWKSFCNKYEAELKDNPAFAELKQELKKHKTSTLLYASKDGEQNHALFLKKKLE